MDFKYKEEGPHLKPVHRIKGNIKSTGMIVILLTGFTALLFTVTGAPPAAKGI
jgi:hypothetical protein